MSEDEKLFCDIDPNMPCWKELCINADVCDRYLEWKKEKEAKS